MFVFYTPLIHFQVFSGCVKWERWPEMGQRYPGGKSVIIQESERTESWQFLKDLFDIFIKANKFLKFYCLTFQGAGV